MANEAVPTLETVQVIVPEGKVDRKIIGRKVVATGEIFHSHTGYHHAPILMDAKTLAKAQR